jgi:uncharacterized membrane protein YtjA (UPF0391 family)
MLRWAATFFVISIIAAMLGFTNIAGSALDVAKVLFVIFLIPAFVLLICGLFVFGQKT